MAIITREIASLGWANASLTMTYDEQPETKGVLTTGQLIRFNLTCSAPVGIKIYRTSDIAWRDFVLPAGTYEYPAGGPVQDISDISFINLGTP